METTTSTSTAPSLYSSVHLPLTYGIMVSVPPPCGYESPNDDGFGFGSGSGSSSRFPSSTHASRREVDPEQAVRSPETASNTSSLAGMVCRVRNLKRSRVSIGDRIACFQWTWFTMTMVCSTVLSVRF